MNRLTEAKLFVDTGDPEEARQVQKMLVDAGYAGLDGATTNPSYFAKNPDVQMRIARGEKFTRDELMGAYKTAAQEIEDIVTGDDVSVEVYADQNTSAKNMIDQARELASWLPGARIKLPIIEQGLEAAETLKHEMRLNMTLCFSQQQAAAVYDATKGAKESVALSPFIGRLDDKGQNGVQFVGNVVRMLKKSDGHIQVLAASFRSVENILESIRVGADILTINLPRLEMWRDQGWRLPDDDFVYEFEGEEISYEENVLGSVWREYDLQHDLTDVGLQRFVDDWNNLLVEG